MSRIGSLDRVGVSGRWGWGALTLVVLGVGTLSALVLFSTAAGAGVGDVPGPPAVGFVSEVGASGVVAQGGGLCESLGVVQFGDVGEDDYGADYILCMRALGLSMGTGEGDYGPDRKLTRGQMASFLVRLWRDVLGMDCPSGVTPFSDVGGSVHVGNIECLYNLGVTTGKTATTYAPRSDLTASQISRFLFRTYEKAGRVCETRDSELDEAVVCLHALRVIPSLGEGRSDKGVTRAQMAVYVIGLWHNLAGPGLPPAPPALSSGSGSEGPVTPPPGTTELTDVLTSPDDGTLTEIDRDWTIPVFMCAPVGMYTSGDLEQLTAVLNDAFDGFFSRLSSRRMTLRFTPGSVLSDDIAWDTTDLGTLFYSAFHPCGEEAISRSTTRQVLIAAEVEPGSGVAGYAGLRHGPAIVPTPAKSRNAISLGTVAHELAHSVLGLLHQKTGFTGRVFLNEGRAGRDFAAFAQRPSLACYQYEQLGWPVRDYDQPCRRLAPSRPLTLSVSQMGDDGMVLTWEPPSFTDNTSVTSYTIGVSRPDVDIYNEPYESYEKDPADRSHTFYGLVPGSGDYRLSVYANTIYGAGELATVYIDLPPTPQPPSPIEVTDITDTMIELSWRDWDKKQGYINLRYEVQYSNGRTTTTGEASSNGIGFLSGLEPGTAYTVRVRSCSHSPAWSIKVCSEWAMLTVSTVSVLPPPDPISIEVGHNWYLLTWEPVPGAVTYQIERPNGAWRSLYRPYFIQESSVEPNTVYSLKILSCGLTDGYFCDWGEWTTVTFSTTDEPAIPPPYQVAIKELDDEWVTVLWQTTYDSSSSYRVEYEYTDGITTSGLLQDPVSDSELRLEVELNKTYTLRLRHCPRLETDIPCSAWTSFRFSTTLSSSPIVPPSIQRTDIGDIWLSLSWDPVPGVSTYDWRYKSTEDDDWQDGGNTTGHSLQLIERLQPDTTYIIELRSCEPTRPCSKWTTANLSTLRSLPPAQPGYPVSVKEVTDTRIHLAWAPPDPLVFYDLKWYPTDERGQTYILDDHVLVDDRILSRLEPNTTYSIFIRMCNWSENIPCSEWVTIEVTTLPRN